MLEFSWFICGFASFVLYCYLFCNKLLNRNFTINKKIIIFSILIGLIYYLINKLNLIYIRPYFLHLYAIICMSYIYNVNIVKTTLSVLLIFIILCISEIIYDLIVVLILKGNIILINSFWLGYLFSNVSIYVLSILLFNSTPVIHFSYNMINWYNKNEYKSLVIVVILCMIIFTFLLYNNLIKFLPNSFLWLINIFCIAVIFFVLNYFKEKANNNRIIDEYDQLLGYVQRYEKVIEDKSKNQHEYKNQLVMLKGMISKSNKKAINYLDSLYKDTDDNEDIELLKKLKYLPSGGLKGLIYYKIEEMIDKDITVFVDISSEIKNIKMDKEIDKNLKDISKIIGVYLDNAIEACINSKEKYIVLEVYLENNEWVFSLSNTYSNKIDFSLVDKEGYTTKGDGKGYGLSLAKDILSHHKELREEKELNGIYYTQRLYINIKK